MRQSCSKCLYNRKTRTG